LGAQYADFQKPVPPQLVFPALRASLIPTMRLERAEEFTHQGHPALRMVIDAHLTEPEVDAFFKSFEIVQPQTAPRRGSPNPRLFGILAASRLHALKG